MRLLRLFAVRVLFSLSYPVFILQVKILISHWLTKSFMNVWNCSSCFSCSSAFSMALSFTYLRTLQIIDMCISAYLSLPVALHVSLLLCSCLVIQNSIFISQRFHYFCYRLIFREDYCMISRDFCEESFIFVARSTSSIAKVIEDVSLTFQFWHQMHITYKLPLIPYQLEQLTFFTAFL